MANLPLVRLVLLIPVATLPQVSMIPAVNLPRVSTTPVANCHRYQPHLGKYATVVNDTTGKQWEQYQAADN
jgi:hypothetical protein